MTFSPYTGAFAPPVDPSRRARSTLGVGAMLLALLALSFAWVPVIGLLMLIPAVLAVLLGILGFTKASVDGKTRRGLPFVATVMGLFAMMLAPAATLVGAMIAVPYGIAIAADQTQVALEHELTRGGMANDDAERIGVEVGDALRSFAQPSNWREGISAAHRFGRLVEDFERDTRQLGDGDVLEQTALLAEFKTDMAALANRYGVELSTEDFDKLVTAFQKHHEREQAERERWEQRMSHGMVITVDRDRVLFDGSCRNRAR